MNTRRRGKEGEELAVEFLRKRGYKILCRNFFSKQGEIDIIAKDRKGLVFVEVKMRNSTGFGYPAEAVTSTKMARMQKTALFYLVKNRLDDIPYRFEVVSILKTGGGHYSIDIIPLDF